MPIVRASTFADPRDIARFTRCKARGGTDRECFKVGDNGIGRWGHITSNTNRAYVALPYEVWQRAGREGGTPVRVAYSGKAVIAELGDTMPHLENITNHCGIDLNPACCKALGIAFGTLTDGVEWEWFDKGPSPVISSSRTAGG